MIMEQQLGEGCFGQVFKGVVKGPISNPKVQPSLKNAICVNVAIKMLKRKCDDILGGGGGGGGPCKNTHVYVAMVIGRGHMSYR